LLDHIIVEALKGANCVVTGGTGMIGAEVVSLLCDAGAFVKSVSLDDIPADFRAETVKADLTDFSVCKDICADMDYVFHVAGIKGSVEITKVKPASFFYQFINDEYKHVGGSTKS
jgi:GDP-L-fucose synthase